MVMTMTRASNSGALRTKLEALNTRQIEIAAEIESIAEKDDATPKAAKESLAKIQSLNAEFDENDERIIAFGKTLDREKNQQRARIESLIPAGAHPGDDGSPRGAIVPGRGGIRVIPQNRSFTEIYGGPPEAENFAGELFRAMAVGIDDHSPESVRKFFNANTTSPDASGGFIVPIQWSSRIVDLARAKMVMMQSGAEVFTLDSEQYNLPTIVADPTFAATLENTPITKSDVVFGTVTMIPRKYAGIVEASNELIDSGINAAMVIQNAIAKSLAVTLDSALLNGDGIAPNILGLFANTDIPTTTLSGVLTREAIDAAVAAVEARNHTPNVCLLSPANYHALSLQQAVDSGIWLGPPDSSKDLTYLPTTSIADTEVAVGDFSAGYAIGLREALRFEVSRTGDGTAWLNDLTSMRAIARIDGAAKDVTAIQIIDTITAPTVLEASARPAPSRANRSGRATMRTKQAE